MPIQAAAQVDDYSYGYSDTEAKKPEAAGKKTDAAAEQSKPADPSFAIAPAPEGQQAPAKQEALSKEPCTDPNSDLCQQWRMAESAAQQAKWTRLQYEAIWYEIGALALTLLATAWAAFAASRAAEAANAGVEIAKTTAERELRAYVCFDDANRLVKEPLGKKIWMVHVVFRNYGQTPAHNVRITVNVAIKPRGFDETLLDTAEHGDGAAPVYLPPGQPTDSFIPFEELDANWSAFKDERMLAFLWGRIDYVDAFNQERWTTFRMRNNYYIGANFAYCETGNDAN